MAASKSPVWSAIGLLVAILAGSAGAQTNALDVSRYPAEMQQHYRVFAEKCSRCHALSRGLEAPYRTEAQWRDLVTRMARRPGAGISSQEQDQITRFLVFYAGQRAGNQPSPAAPSPAAPGPLPGTQPGTAPVAATIDGVRVEALTAQPQPVRTQRDGQTVEEAPGPEDTVYLIVRVTDPATNEKIPYAQVHARVLGEGGAERDLVPAFGPEGFHYGANFPAPRGRFRIAVTVNPPPLPAVGAAAPRLTQPVTVEFSFGGEQPLAQAPAAAPAPATGGGFNLRWSGSGEVLYWNRITGSLRQPIFASNDKNSTFKATHFHPKLTATLGAKAMAYLEACITHPQVGTQAEQAWLEYNFSPRANLQAGRILIPFGQWNQIHDVFDHKSISYPLMYVGHEEEEVELRGGPAPIVSTGYSDIGALLYGSIWPRRSDQLWYGAYVCNGRFGTGNIEWLDLWNHQEDNNSDKAVGGRLVYTRGDNWSLGASYQTGKYDPANKLRYQFQGVDLLYRLRGRVTLRAEYVRDPVDSPTQGYNKKGWWAQIDFPLGRQMEFVATASGLSLRPAQRVEDLRRYTLGVNRLLTPSLKLKTELEFLDIGRFVGSPSNADDTRLGTSFKDTLRIKSSLVAAF